MARHRATRPTPSTFTGPRHHARHSAPLRRRTWIVTPLAVLSLISAATAVAPSAGPGDAARLASVNLVADPDFTQGGQAWTVTPGGSRHVVAGRQGHPALAITNVTSAPRTMNLNDAINTVAQTRRGFVYTASAWFRVTVPSVSVAVRQSAWRGSATQGRPALRSAWLQTAAWRFLSVSYTATSDGNSIDLNFLAWRLPPGVTVVIDEPALTASDPATSALSRSPSSPPASATPSTTGSTSKAPTPSTSSITTPPKTAPPMLTPPMLTPPKSAAPVTTPSSGSGRLVFDDEFNGTSVDRSKWRVRNNTWGTNEYSILTSRPQNVFVSNGLLTLRAQRERYTAYGSSRAYTSGYLDTIGLHSQEYGRWEMRAKLPTSKGLWPAFWLRADHTLGEIDILESVGGLNRMTSQTVLESTMVHTVRQTHTYDVSGSIADWHVYGFSWTPAQMSWDIDGVTVFTVKASDYAWSAGAAFRDTMNIRLNLQVGGDMPAWWKSDVDASTRFPADYQIDWVRAYAG